MSAEHGDRPLCGAVSVWQCVYILVAEKQRRGMPALSGLLPAPLFYSDQDPRPWEGPHHAQHGSSFLS